MNKKRGEKGFAILRKVLMVTKLTVALMCMVCIQLQARSYAQYITLKTTNKPLEQIFQAIEQQTGFVVLYNYEELQRAKPVSLSVHKMEMTKLLDKVFLEQPFSYTIEDKTILIIKKKNAQGLHQDNAVIRVAEAQQRELNGTVTDEQGQPLAGVTVTIKGTSVVTTTNASGRYQTAMPANAKSVVFSMMGYGAVEREIGSSQTMDVILKTSISDLDEVVVVGYGAVKRGDLTGSVASVGSSEVQSTPIVALDRAMQGRVSGVNVITNSARPGGSTTVRIRGTGSVNAGNEPLYVIDGFPTGNLNSINTNDIESIEVLKDASATAIYGSRGSNGVILVTTKRGKAGKSIVSYDGYYGQQSVRHQIPLLNAKQFAEFVNEANVNSGGAPYFDGSAADRPLPETLGEGTDWQDAIMRDAPIQDHQLTALGGSEKNRYALSLGYYGQKGIILRSDFNRYSFRANVDSDVSSRLKVGLSTQAAYTNGNSAETETAGNTSYGNLIPAALNYSPTLPILNEDGSYNIYTGPLNGLGADNPYAMAKEYTNKSSIIRVLSNAYAELEIIDGLKLRSTIGADLLSNKASSYTSKLVLAGASLGGKASVASAQTINWLNENTLTYDKQLGEQHHLNAMIGYTYQQSNYETATANANNFNDDFALYHNLGSGSTLVAPSSGATDWRLISYIARVNYGFDDRFLFTLTGRRDGSSRFGPNNKFGFFPSGAVAWKLKNESWLRDIQKISDAKLRVSYGLSGNQEIDNYRYVAGMSSLNYVLGGTLFTGNAPNIIPNPDLRWEKNAQLDLGVDLGFFDNRLSFTGDYYHKTTSNLLFDVGVPTNSGFSTMLQNIGKVENHGVELAINAAIIDKADLKWTTAFNITFNKNKVLALDKRKEFRTGGDAVISNTGLNPILLRVGEPLSNFYGYEMDGIFQSAEEVATSAQPTAKPGDIRYVDQNGDHVINDDDRAIIGNANPSSFGGWNNTFSYKGFDLNVFIQGVFGNEILNYGTFDQLNMTGGNNLSKRALDRWTPENPSNTIPRANASGGSRILSSFQVEDGSYIRFKTITLGYTLPGNLLRGWSVSQLRIYVSGQNLFTLTDYTGYDPEVNRFGNSSISQGIDYGVYPSAKTFLFGLNLKF
ncbi:TonB-dependent receptor [Olivibacter ginsenosidimutans]|uniref:TonB-dependent receptor n=1 Tax=Olivibacter ginsenosidimutans TaxID=1176537 RepID=A0ABP9C3Z0_9SPHI